MTAAAHTGGAAGNALIALVESHWGGGYRIVVVGLAVARTGHGTVLSIRTLAAAAAVRTVAHRGSDVVSVTIIIGVVRVVVVVVVVDGFVARIVVMMIPGTMVGIMRVIPTPTVAESVVVPAG